MTLKLEKHLVLSKYFLNLFGFNDFNDLREKLKDTEEGFDSTDRSYFVNVLIGLKPSWEEELLRYDDALKEYVEKLRKNRRQPSFNLKYFQYMSVLFTEIFLNRFFNDKEELLKELNEFLRNFNNETGTEIPIFTEKDVQKLAFWMATGSGKTLIMHANYWQILKYSRNKWDNIILITPNDGLSKQHYEELKLSGIPCKLYDGNIDNLKTGDEEILIIDIHKLTEEKKGEGVTVDISYFDGKNLVFIDEGHKGQKSEEQKWKKLREEIGKNGLVLEYSATFGQVIGKNKDLLEEYAKAIIFDYSYKYFYIDGYGKDFYVYNIKEDAYTEKQRDLLLTASLLSFYEQLIMYKKYDEELREYNIEKPLWIFVGSRVKGKGLNSDVVRIIQFIDKIIKDENYLKENIRKILEGKSGLVDNEGNDIFNEKFDFIRNFQVEDIVDDIYRNVFNGTGRLELYEIKNAEGEIGLKVPTEEKYFGVINVGDVHSLRKLIEGSEIEVREDHFSSSLFFGINENNSTINILIGSKKFVEGWNSWRVSNMGLINMGKGEGPQIIQLFGRGVRLKGKDYSLKRVENPDYKLKALQTLFIFGLNADYIKSFLLAMDKEEVDYEEIAIPIKFNMPEKWEGSVYTIKTKENFDFSEYPIKLTIKESILKDINIDLRPKITLVHGLKVGTAETSSDKSVEVPKKLLAMIDWDYIYLEVMNYKIMKGFYNLIIDKKILMQIIESGKYQVFITELPGIRIYPKNDKSILDIESFRGIEKLHDIILMVVKNYIYKFYRKEEKRKTMDYLEVVPLTAEHENMFPENNEIVLKVPKSLVREFEELIEQIRKYEESGDNIPCFLKDDVESIPTIYFDRHLYAPLISYKKERENIKSIPVKLNKGETKFVKDLRNFINSHKMDLPQVNELFLLRNLSQRGISFFISSGFYPDFIIWIKNGRNQNIIFVDPKGLVYRGNFNDEKIQFCKSFIKEIEKKVNKELKDKDEKITLHLDAFIISVSKYDDIKASFGNGNHSREEFELHNVIFQERDYIRKMFEKVGVIA